MPDFDREKRLRSKQRLDTRIQVVLTGEGYGRRDDTGRWISEPLTLNKWARRDDSQNEVGWELGQGYREQRSICFYMRYDARIVPGAVIRDGSKELTVTSVEEVGRRRYMLAKTGDTE